MKRSALSVILLLFFLYSYNQITIKVENISNIAVDKLNNIYIISGAELKKYNSQGNYLFQYSNAVYGQINSIDASNPLRILVFFKESNALVFLNQQLAEVSDPIEIDDLGDFQAQLVSSSSIGGFWVYDEIAQSIIHFNSNRLETTRTQNILSLSQTSQAVKLQEQNNTLYLSLQNQNTLLFDQFGTYLRKIPVVIQSHIQMHNNAIQFWNSKAWCEYNTLQKTTTIIMENKEDEIIKIIKNNQNWISQYNDHIEIESINSKP